MSSVSSGWITIGCQSGRIPSGPWLNFLRDAIVIQTWSFWTSRKFLNNVQIFLNIVQRTFDSKVLFLCSLDPKKYFFSTFFCFFIITTIFNAQKRFLKNSPHDVQTKGGGVKGFLNNVKKTALLVRQGFLCIVLPLIADFWWENRLRSRGRVGSSWSPRCQGSTSVCEANDGRGEDRRQEEGGHHRGELQTT